MTVPVDAAAEHADSPPDAPRDSSSTSVDPESPFGSGWSTAPGTPAYCNLRIADDPATLASNWIACPSGRVGCRLLDTSWTKRVGQKLDAQVPTDSVRVANGIPYFKIRRTWPPSKPPGAFGAYVDVIEPLDGAPVLAVGTEPFPWKGEMRSCFIQGTFGDYGFGFQAVPRDPDLAIQAEGSDENVFGWASWAAPTTLTTKAWSPSQVGAPGAYSVGITMGDRGFWLAGAAPQTAFAFEVTTQTGLIAQGRPFVETASGVPGGALVFDANSPYAIAFLKNDGSLVRLVTPTSPQFVTWKTLDRSSGNALVWVESDDGFQYKNATLWTSPYATSEAQVVRRKVAKLNDTLFRGGARAPANKGVFLSLVGRNTALLTRLSDGLGWLIQAEPQTRFVDPLWVDDNDVFLETADDSDPSFDLLPSGLVRISRASLGAPTVASGL